MAGVANLKHLAILRQGVEEWNSWRKRHPDLEPDLSEARLQDTDLRNVNLYRTNLYRADLTEADLSRADFGPRQPWMHSSTMQS